MALKFRTRVDLHQHFRALNKKIQSEQSFIDIRLLPGFARNLKWVTDAGFDPALPLHPDTETSIGVHPGAMGPWGIPLLLGLLVECTLLSGQGQVNGCTVSVVAELKASMKSEPTPSTSQVTGILNSLGVSTGTGKGLIWKDATEAGHLPKLVDILGERRTIFLGARRTLPFAKAIGVSPDAFIALPETGAYVVIPQLVQALREKMSLNHSPTPVLVHAAGTVGNIVALLLAREGIAIKSIDLGLPATIFDHEYLATRPWFRSNAMEILRTARKLAKNSDDYQLLANSQLTQLERSVRSIASWQNIRQLEPVSPEIACSQLRSVVEQLHGCVEAPILKGALLLWEWVHFRKVDATLLKACVEHDAKYEPWLLAAAVMDMSGNRELARELVSRAEKSCPLDLRLEGFREIVQSSSPEADRELRWRRELQQKGRPDLGSKLTWSIDGDLPSGRVR